MEKNTSNTTVAIVFDFETGGLECKKCAATQLSMHAVRLDTFEVIGTFNEYIKPYSIPDRFLKPKSKTIKTKYEIEDEEEEIKENKLMRYDAAALTVSDITLDLLNEKGKELEDVCQDAINFIKDNALSSSRINKPILVGQNPLFDIGFLQQILTFTGKYKEFSKCVAGAIDFFGNFQPYYIDTLSLCKLVFSHDKTFVSYKLEIEAERLGIDLDDAHDADADVTATQEVMHVLGLRMRNTDGGNDSAKYIPAKKEKERDHFKI
jgi:DNA polymerase III epsilon subunit-like protein